MASPQQQAQSQTRAPRIHVVYRFWFLVLEPISALVGAYFAHCRQQQYLSLLDSASAPASTVVPLATSVALSQLANMYAFFALNEAMVLRSTADLAVWRATLAVLLAADVGHLYSVRGLGAGIYYGVFRWNAADWGNVPWVYVGATLRVCFLAGFGLRESRVVKRTRQ